MRICVPTETDQGLAAPVCGHFGSAPYFTLVDTESGETEVVPNRGHQHGHGNCAPLRELAGQPFDAVVCGGMGRRAAAALAEQGLGLYIAPPGTVDDLLAAFRADQLQEAQPSQLCGGHGHGAGGGCGQTRRHRHGNGPRA
jgi:predicted Fe-Mo cluster-binding NifX family protein